MIYLDPIQFTKAVISVTWILDIQEVKKITCFFFIMDKQEVTEEIDSY